METNVIKCKSWAGFKSTALPSLFKNGVASRGKYYFRGQGSETWPLMSSFDRWYPDGGLELGKKATADRFLQLFRDETSRLTPDPLVSSDPEQVLAFAQHYGVPTRLLDWTESPYVAAFFAFSGIVSFPIAGEHIAVWCLDTTSKLWSEETGISLLSTPSPYNERLKNQLGKFTLLQSPFDSADEHIEKCDATGRTLQKITLPATEAKVALSDLDFMGINYSTIYPGLEGCARAANLRMLLKS